MVEAIQPFFSNFIMKFIRRHRPTVFVLVLTCVGTTSNIAPSFAFGHNVIPKVLTQHRLGISGSVQFVSADSSVRPASSVETILQSHEALAAYCSGLHAYEAMLKKADQTFGLEYSEEKLSWIKKNDALQTEAVEKNIGLSWEVYSPYAMENDWQQKCDAE